MHCLSENFSDLTVSSPQCDILLCSDMLVSDMHYVSETLVPGFGRLVYCAQEGMPRAREMAYIRDGYETFHPPKFECGCCKMLFWLVCGVRQNVTCLVFTTTLT